ncbi:UNKNOWN [Stylonychia lemnae]|uniref:Uncharacterized protein n=1 Tax=Stylonychia lemnae TaxID=5949 RepID=A0A078AB01_STYLE|nr:UNKNOWN [Stylonychia lemnae]|eukprot:CDW78782.1 UNKNOWN [Stylonychia lemnae]
MLLLKNLPKSSNLLLTQALNQEEGETCTRPRRIKLLQLIKTSESNEIQQKNITCDNSINRSVVKELKQQILIQRQQDQIQQQSKSLKQTSLKLMFQKSSLSKSKTILTQNQKQVVQLKQEARIGSDTTEATDVSDTEMDIQSCLQNFPDKYLKSSKILGKRTNNAMVSEEQNSQISKDLPKKRDIKNQSKQVSHSSLTII